LQQALFKLRLPVGYFHVNHACGAEASGISGSDESAFLFCKFHLLALAPEDRTNPALKCCMTAGTVDGFMTGHDTKLRIRRYESAFVS
jgi:hypothetical protein